MTCQRDFMQKLRVGVVGLGGHAYRNVLPTLHNLPVKLAALCDVDADLLARTEAEYRTGAAFTDAAMFQQATQVNLDAVLLCTGPRFHPALTLQAFAAGLDVWMEKPPAMRAAQIETLLAARGDRVCAVGFKKACMSAAQKARELLALPEFGALQSMQGVYRVTIPRDGARSSSFSRSGEGGRPDRGGGSEPRHRPLGRADESAGDRHSTGIAASPADRAARRIRFHRDCRSVRRRAGRFTGRPPMTGPEPQTWHYGVVARWWAEFNTDGPEIDYFRDVRRGRAARARRGMRHGTVAHPVPQRVSTWTDATSRRT